MSNETTVCFRGHPPRPRGSKCPPCNLLTQHAWQARNPEQWAEIRRLKARKRHAANRLAALAHYGGACACCGETFEGFLVIDHIDGNGNEHRKAMGARTGVFLWLKRNGYPPGFQVLCANCNMAKERPGGCRAKGHTSRQPLRQTA